MTRVIFVRHGQTIWNNLGKYQGHTDVPLNKTGIEQAYKVAKRLKHEQVDAIYASDLQRAKQTAEIIALEHKLPVITKPEFKEINFGIWEGKTYSEIKSLYPELVKIWHNDPQNLVIPQGETFEQMLSRAWTGLKEVISKHPGKSIIIVAHGGTISSLICKILGVNLKNLWSIKQGNTGISIIEFYDQKGIITLLNDTYHLEIS